MAGDVFISYSSKDADIVKLVRKGLEDNGISVWMAPESIPTGSNYSLEVPKGIEDCKVFLLILSKNSQESRWALRELDEAISSEKRIIPFQIDECELNDACKFVLNQCQTIKADGKLKESLDKLINIIKESI